MSPLSQPHPTTIRPRRWKHGAIPVIGLIGGIGGGKSLVASLLAARGAVVIDADRVGHEVLDQAEVRREVVRRFGPGVQASPSGPSDSGPIDRQALGAIVFSEPAALHDLEAILHPRMEQRFRDDIARAVREGVAPAVVLDAAILLERGWDRECDRVVFVDAPRAERLRRVASARGWDDDTLRAREAAQWPVESKRARADVVLDNAAGMNLLESAVDGLLDSLAPPAANDLIAGPDRGTGGGDPLPAPAEVR